MPEGADVTFPDPGPKITTVSGWVGGGGVNEKEAVTDLSEFMTTVQFPDPVQAPDQPEKVPEEAVGVSVMEAPSAKSAWQALPQLIPAGIELTDPDPDPERATVRW